MRVGVITYANLGDEETHVSMSKDFFLMDRVLQLDTLCDLKADADKLYEGALRLTGKQLTREDVKGILK